jgi:hypothetical protein
MKDTAALSHRAYSLGNAALDAAFSEIDCTLCTKSGHSPVNGLHSLENKCTYKGVISID